MIAGAQALRIIALAAIAAVAPARAAEAAGDGAMLASPDGRWQAYERQTDRGVQIWIHDRAGASQRALIRLPGDNRHAAWSPDSLFLAFCATFQGRRFITVSDLTGHSWLVAEINGDCNTPVWSPDASQLAFRSRTRAGDTDVYVASAGGTLHRNLTRTRGRDEAVGVWRSGAAMPEIQTSVLK